MTPIFEVKDLHVDLHAGKLKSKNNNKKAIVSGVSFEVFPGECLGILGESGSGKSMTMKAVLGLLDRNFEISGEAFFMGKDLLKENKESLRRVRGKDITMILQNPMTCFDPLYRVGHQMAETFLAHTSWKAEEINRNSIQILERMHIRNPEEVLEKYPHQLSGGMLQRIMIGIALALKPSLLIADEPTTAIDAITQHEILNEFQKIKEEFHTSMIFITHDLGAISKVADKIIVMNQGKIADRGDFQYINTQAQDPYTKLLVEKRKAVMTKYQSVLYGRGE